MKLKIMGKTENDQNEAIASTSSGAGTSFKYKQKSQGKKRKRESSESSNEDQIIIADNALETERNVHVSAMKNNLDETSVRKIIKKVVTNDHVLALVKLREEEEASRTDHKKPVPKLTRAKVKELKKVSTNKSAAWDLEKLELTPIKHIPVKTRPEVKALIAQELPEDEDDDEYEPTHDEVPSDDDHIESCSDLDSQPRTPATPAKTPSPRVVKDGPFKVPQDISKARRKLEIEEEEATIALRTRSKLSLSATSIEHIESTFVPPDDLPIQDVDDLWNEFLNECLNPTSVGRANDDDDETLDETDPEYNVAADPDAHDEDEEALSNSIIKISKKELNDLVTELFSILPETSDEDLVGSGLPDSISVPLPKWEGKQEPPSDDESRHNQNPSKKLQFEKEPSTPVTPKNTSTKNMEQKGKSLVQNEKQNNQNKVAIPKLVVEKVPHKGQQVPRLAINGAKQNIEISIEECALSQPAAGVCVQRAPPSLREQIKPTTQTVTIQIESNVTMNSEQLQIFQQQMRQHVQLATSNFMQTVVHPEHWKLAPQYKEYLESLVKMADNKPASVVDVCNLRPAYELITIWEKSVTEDNEQNRKMIEFLVKDVEKSRRRVFNNSFYGGEFHEMLKKVIANSPVFLYPYLLPSMPFRPDPCRKFSYSISEDTLIVLGLDQFWQYVESNPEIYKLHPRARGRSGYAATLGLVAKHMFPWIPSNRLAGHVNAVRAAKDELNPIHRYFKYNEVPKIEHMILSYNPALTLYEQPEHEMPRIWARYLAKTSQRFKKFIQRRPTTSNGRQPVGVKVNVNLPNTVKRPLPIDFTKEIVSSRKLLHEDTPPTSVPFTNRLDININKVDLNTTQEKTDQTQNNVLVPQNFYRLVQTSTGAYLLPIQISVDPNTVNNLSPSTSSAEISSTIISNNLPEQRAPTPIYSEHCECCILLRKICKKRQTLITEYFKKEKEKEPAKCYCNNMTYPKITNKLKLLVNQSKKKSEIAFKELDRRLKGGAKGDDGDVDENAKDMAQVLSYQVKVFTQASMCHRIKVKKRIYNLLSFFDIEASNPVKLAMDLFKAFDVELVDLFLDFMAFLTPQQAEKMAAFKDYFVRNCVKDLMNKIEELVQDKATRLAILIVLKTTISRRLSPCDMCATLLRLMDGYETLAKYTFYLFPHTRENRPVITSPVEPLAPLVTRDESEAGGVNEEADEINEMADEVNETADEANETARDELQTTVDYEADDSSSDDEDALSMDLSRPPDPEATAADTPSTEVPQPIAIKMETTPEAPQSSTQPTNNKPTEDSDSDQSEPTLSIDESPIKEEMEDTPNWTKEEDRTILKILQEHLTKEERHDLTILDLLEAKNVYGMLFDSLDRTINQIKERVMYLLTLLIVSELDT